MPSCATSGLRFHAEGGRRAVPRLLFTLLLPGLLVILSNAGVAAEESALGRGDSGPAVLNAQDLLNQYLALSMSTLPLIQEDGIFGPETQNAVEEFEASNGGTIDGLLSVNERNTLRLAVESLEVLVPNFGRGDDSPSVQTWQAELNNWSRLTEALLPIENDGIFGPNTEAATMAFEASVGKQVDGIVEPGDRIAMRATLVDLRSDAGDLPPFEFGSTGPLVQSAQSLLNEYIALGDVDLPLLREDGLYGRETRDAVSLYELDQGLPPDGILTRSDYDELRLTVAALEAAAPDSVLTEGDTGNRVLVWQRQLTEWLTLAGIDIDPGRDGVFGKLTTSGTIAFERTVGVQVDGVVEPEDRDAMREDLRRLREVALDSLVEGADSMGELVQADDFTSRHADILRLYFVFFDRSPDLGGAKFWIAQGDQGSSIADIAGEFVGSAEFQQRYGDVDNADFVTLLYRNALEREPDPAGLGYWIAQLDNGDLTRVQVVSHFAFSPEFVQAHPFGDK